MTVRPLAAVLALGLLLGACGGDDDPEVGAPVADEAAALVDDACALVPVDRLDQATGLVFDDSVTSRDQCIFTSTEGRSAMSLNLFTGGGRSAEEIVERGSERCDAGTAVDLPAGEVAGGFACLEGGVPTVTVVSRDDVVYVLRGGTLNEGAQAEPLLRGLSDLLAAAAKS